jgi:hypothetical protein
MHGNFLKLYGKVDRNDYQKLRSDRGHYDTDAHQTLLLMLRGGVFIEWMVNLKNIEKKFKSQNPKGNALWLSLIIKLVCSHF